MAKRALVAAVNDYSTWNGGVTIGSLTLTAPNLHWCLADANDFSQLLGSAQESDEVRILGGFPESDEFGLGGGQSLCFQQEIIQIAVAATTP